MRISSAERSHHRILPLLILARFACPMALFNIGALAPRLRESLHLSHEDIGYLVPFLDQYGLSGDSRRLVGG